MEIEKLRHQNETNSRVIRILSAALNDESEKMRFLNEVEDHERNETEKMEKIIAEMIKKTQEKKNTEYKNREQELLALIEQKQAEFDKLAQQIDDYQQKANEFEAEMEKNEREKQELLDNLRNRETVVPQSPYTPNKQLISLLGSPMNKESDEEIQEKIKAADGEIAALTKEYEELSEKLKEKQEEYNEIQEKFKALQD